MPHSTAGCIKSSNCTNSAGTAGLTHLTSGSDAVVGFSAKEALLCPPVASCSGRRCVTRLSATTTDVAVVAQQVERLDSAATRGPCCRPPLRSLNWPQSTAHAVATLVHDSDAVHYAAVPRNADLCRG